MKIFSFLQEDNGGLSSMRLFSFITITCMGIDWIHAIFTVGKYSPDIALISLVLGVVGAKVIQKPFEKNEENINAKSNSGGS